MNTELDEPGLKGLHPQQSRLREMMNKQEFHPRFVNETHLTDLSNLWHLSRTACSQETQASKRFKRLQWVSAEFAKKHPYVTSTAVYKDLQDMLEFSGL